MSTVIQPATGQTIVTTDEQNHHRGHDNHHGDSRFDAVEARADFRALTNEVERFGTLNGDRVKDGFSIAGDRITAVGSAAQVAACRTDSLVQAGFGVSNSLVQVGFGSTADRICDATKDLTNTIGAGQTADALAACKLSDAVAESKLQTAIGFKDSIIANNVGFSAQTVLSSTIGNAAQVLATGYANQASNQATNNFNMLTVQTERVRAELLTSQQVGFAAAQLAAFQNKADSDAKAAACCCELKSLIISEAAATRAQAADFRMRELEGRLVATARLLPVTIPVGAG